MRAPDTPFRGQRNNTGLWWSATTGGHVGFEPWLERDHLTLLDFDPAVVGMASQPFWLFWQAEDGRARSHAPDFFARLRNGCGLVVDVRPAGRVRSRDAAAFGAAERACARVGADGVSPAVVGSAAHGPVGAVVVDVGRGRGGPVSAGRAALRVGDRVLFEG